jgi:hypothetical protein
MGCCVSTPGVVENELQDGSQPKKDVLLNFTAECTADALLTMIPGRMFANGASNNACLFTQQGRKGTNQDAMVVWEVWSFFPPRVLSLLMTHSELDCAQYMLGEH